MFCPICGQQNEDSAVFCAKCGASLKGAPVPAYNYGSSVFGDAIKKTFATLGKKPMLLWGLSLLGMVLTYLIAVLGVLPIITIPVTVTLEAGMACIFLDSYQGKTVNSDQLFMGFKSFPRVAGGMCWYKFWTFLWALIPIAGPIIAIYKLCQYAFTPYILIQDKDVSATQAIRNSMQMTSGYRGQIFLGFFLPPLCIILLFALLTWMLIAVEPARGFIGVLTALISIFITAVYPLFSGILQSAIYTEVRAKKGM